MAVIIPDKDQVNQSQKKWKESRMDVIVVSALSYIKENELYDAINKLKGKDIDLVVMDCIDYTLGTARDEEAISRGNWNKSYFSKKYCCYNT